MKSAAIEALETTEQRYVFYGVDWDFYDFLLEQIGDRHVFVTYDRGTLEIMSPSSMHEYYAAMLGRLIEALTEELEMPIRSGGQTTFRKKDLDRGLEPDKCYWIQNERRGRGKRRLSLAVDPAPDLAIEVEISRRLAARESIYADLGVPEVWRYDGAHLRVLCLTGGKYKARARSRALPMLPVAVVERFLKLLEKRDETSVVRAFRQWVRENLVESDRPKRSSPRRRRG